MDEREQLKNKGYDVQTKDFGIGWQCSLEWHNRLQTFHAATEAASIKLAAEYVAKLEEGFQNQQRLMACEGCGEVGF